jgi:SlyX protein
MPTQTQRIDELESRMAFFEDTISSLNDALVAQQNRMDDMEAMLKAVVDQLGKIIAQEPEGEEPPPPHY